MTKLWQKTLAKERVLARKTLTTQMSDLAVLLEYARLGARRKP